MLRDEVENPMVVEAHWSERPADIVCPHCSSVWWVPEDTPGRDGVLSASGQYCIECLEGEKGTKEALLDWYAQDVDKGDLMRYYFRDAYGLYFSGTDPDVILLLDMLQEHRSDTFMELLRDYSRNEDRPGRADAWVDYLKENN